MLSQYTTDAKIKTPESPELGIGVTGLLRNYQLYFDDCKRVHFEIKNVVAADSCVAVEYVIVGAAKKPNSSIVTNVFPKGIELNNCSVFRFKKNKIFAETIYSNKVVHD